jgi:hypothetical protein
METKYIVIAIVVLVLIFCIPSKNEGYGPFCGNCQDLTPEQCAKCSNCGVCKTDSGCKKCVQGDEAGPFFNDNCVDWEYMGKTPNNKCWNYTKNSPYNCGYYYPYNKRAILHPKFATLKNQLGTLSA